LSSQDVPAAVTLYAVHVSHILILRMICFKVISSF